MASVFAWHRFGAAIQQVLARLFCLVYARYVDDLFVADAVISNDQTDPATLVEPHGAAELARWVVQDLLGWELDAEKAVSGANEFTALGVDVQFDEHDRELVFRVGSQRLSSWRKEIEECLRREMLAPSHAKKLAGKLSWGSSMVFGRGARVYLAPLFQHAAGKSPLFNDVFKGGR